MDEVVKNSPDLRLFFELSLDPMCVLDLSGRFLKVNPAFERMLGYPAGELVSQTYHRFVHPEDLAATKAEGTGLAHGRPVFNFENRYRRPDGSWRRLSWRAAPPGEDGLLYAVARDITKEAEFREATRITQEKTLEFQRMLLRLRDDARVGVASFLRLVTEECASALELERVGIWFFADDGESIECRDLYVASRGQHESGARVDRRDCPSYFKTISSHDALLVRNAQADSATREFWETYLRPNNIASLLDVPIRSGHRLLGVLCCEHVGELRAWTSQEEKFVTSVAAYIMLAIERAERQQSEEAVRELNENLEQRIEERTSELISRERRFAALVEQVQDYAIFILDLEGRVASWNTGAFRLKGYTADEIIGRHHSIFYNKEEQVEGRPQQFLRRARELGRAVDEGWRTRKDGTRFWAQVVLTAIYDTHGRLIEYGKVTRDLTTRKRSESILRESEEQFRSAMENSAIGMALVAPDGRFLKVNAALCTILGYTSEELCARDFQAITHSEDLGTDLDNVQALLAGHVLTFQMEKRYLHANGSIVWALLNVSLVREEGGKPRYFISQIQDISQRKLAEETRKVAFEQQKELARQAMAGERAKSEFLAMMSHEVRTPMNGVLGFAQLLANMPDLPEEGRAYVDTIVRSGTTLLRILDDILDLSRLEFGSLGVEAGPFSPSEMMHDIRTLLTPAAQSKGVEIELVLPEESRGIFIGDAGRIRQIVLNLVGNAIKFTEEGTVSLEIRREGGDFEFVVRDTGCGINEENLERLFEPFVQGDSGNARRHGGAGLGLSISKRLANLMGGALTAKSLPDGGSEFVARIPLSAALLPVPGLTVPMPASEQTIDPEFSNRNPLSVLVVEDDPVNLKLVLVMLRKLGYSPLFAKDGVEAVELYRRDRPQCILMDLQMPRMDGIEATYAIRRFEALANTPPAFISALTANTLTSDRDRCFESGMDRFLNKPLRYDLLTDVLKVARLHLAAWGG